MFHCLTCYYYYILALNIKAILDNVIKNLNLNITIVKSKSKESNIIELKKLEYNSSLVNSKIYIKYYFFIFISNSEDNNNILIL